MDNSETLLHRTNGVSRRNLLTGAGAVAASASPTGATESDRSRPFPCPSILALQILNVKQGWTADGHPAPHAPTRVPDCDLDLIRASDIAGNLYRQLSDTIDLDDAARTRILRKTIDHLQRCSRPMKLHWREAGLFLASHPRALWRDLAFADYADLWRNHIARVTRLKQRRILAVLDARRAEMNPPPCRVLWSDGEGGNQIVTLTHPFHVWEEGLRNLDRLLYPRHSQNRPETADEINRLSHWLMIEKGCCLIYSLRAAGHFQPTATLIHTPVRTTLHADGAGAHAILKSATPTVASRFVTTHFMATDAFRAAFLDRRLYDACLPWGPEHHPPRHQPAPFDFV